jgi:predicted adenylyl cyclase CyaB
MISISEIKAKCIHTEPVRQILKEHGAVSKGTDFQTDTYFDVRNGRLKLREGNVENALIYYERDNTATAKQSRVVLHKIKEASVSLKEVLLASHAVKVVVKKKREIYFIGNVKFHIDEVEGLGSFVEIEAIDEEGIREYAQLKKQCQAYMDLLGISEADLLTHSYSDILLREA